MINAPRRGQTALAILISAQVVARAAVRLRNPFAYYRDWLTGPKGEPLVISFRRGPTISARRGTTDRWIATEVFLTDLYRPDPRFRIPPSARVMDIGAHAGYFAAYAASAHPDVRVAAFEPTPGSYDRLQATIQTNALDDRVKAFRVAVAGSAGVRAFAVHEFAERNSLLDEVLPAGDAILEKIQVETATLSSALSLAGFDRCELIKMDCEGAEYEIIAAASDEDLARFDRMILEYHEGDGLPGAKVLAERLRAAEFEVWEHPRLPYLYAVRRV